MSALRGEVDSSTYTSGRVTLSKPYLPTEQTITGRNHYGCVEFSDPEELIAKGDITKIEVGQSGVIYGFRLTYGKNGQGLWHLGPEKNNKKIEFVTWQVPEGERIVRVEGDISGNYITRLRFFTDKGSASRQFGRKEGRKFTVTAPGIGGLRTLSGQVNQKKQSASDILRAVTSITFSFGAPYYIKEVNYDEKALEAARLKAVPERLVPQEIPNQTSVEQTVSYTNTKKYETEKTLTFKETTGMTFGMEVEAGLPGFVDAKCKFELSTTLESGQSFTKKDSQEVTWSVPVRVPPNRKVVAISTIKHYSVTVPFTYTVVWYWGTRDHVLGKMTLPGEYRGVQVEDLKHEFKELPLD